MGHIIVKAVLGISLVMQALTPAFAQQPTIRVATEASFPPFSQTEPDGRYTGFEIDLGNDVCRRIQVTCEWVKQDFDGMIPALQARKFDMIFSSMSIKPERQRVADFSIPYYAPTYRFYARKGAVTSVPDGLKGKKVGVYAGATQEQYLNAKLKGVVEPRGYKNIDQIHADLVAGRIDAAFNEAVPAAEFLRSEQGKEFEFVGPEFNDPEIFGPGAGAMFRKGDPLREKVNAAIRAAYADGTFDRLAARYFPGVNMRADKTW
ncbi:MAG TPA: transporter substrate-binding domain-containing protein [Microvirga sp.]|jgi:lysine/arginine/ornithine transport system substrate-binding protein|nr:transporter substrate-binding domain-containing protein [Microvirga sp.]